MWILSPEGAVTTALAGAAVLFFRDALPLSISRPGRRFDAVHTWEKWLHPAKLAAIGAWAWVVFGSDMDRPLFSSLPPAAAPGLAWAGAALAVAGVALACWGKVTMGQSFASRIALHERHALVTGGPYRLVRHPIYAGALGVFWGVVLVSDSVAGLLTWGIFFTWMVYVHTIAEEALLEKRFGDAFREYKRSVPRLVPFV